MSKKRKKKQKIAPKLRLYPASKDFKNRNRKEARIDNLNTRSDAGCFYPLVDLRFLSTYYFYDQELNLDKEENTCNYFKNGDYRERLPGLSILIAKTIINAWNIVFRIHSKGPNAVNFLTSKVQRMLNLDIAKKKFDFSNFCYKAQKINPDLSYSYTKGDKKVNKVFDRIYTLEPLKKVPFMLLFDKIPLVRELRIFQSPHMKLQEGFNSQTFRSCRNHKKLEELLSKDEIDFRRVSKLKFRYQLSLFSKLQKEEALFREIKGRYTFKVDGKYRRAFKIYENIVELKRTSYDLMRNIAMRYVQEVVLAGGKLYKKIESEKVKSNFKVRFLNIDLGKLIHRIDPMFDTKNVRRIANREYKSFKIFYKWFKEEVLEEQIGMLKQVGDYGRRYEQAINSNNKEFLIDSIDGCEFDEKLQFDREFGKLERVGHAYDFVRRRGSELSGMLKKENIENWILAEENGYLESFLNENEVSRREAIGKAIETDPENGLIVADAIKRYERCLSAYQKSEKYQGVAIGNWDSLLEKDPNLMAEYVDGVEEQMDKIRRTKKRIHKQQVKEEEMEQVEEVEKPYFGSIYIISFMKKRKKVWEKKLSQYFRFGEFDVVTPKEKGKLKKRGSVYLVSYESRHDAVKLAGKYAKVVRASSSIGDMIEALYKAI